MSDIRTTMDIIMCMLWILAYIFVYIGTYKYKFPAISPLAQCVISSVEFAITIHLIKYNTVFNYAFFSYLFWAFVEIAIINLIFKLGYLDKKHLKAYVLFIMVLITIGCLVLELENGMLYITHIYTLIGMIFWYYHILDINYPIKPINLIMFIIKFIGDSCDFLVYFSIGDFAVKVMIILLLMVDFFFILTYLFRRFYKEKYEIIYEKYSKFLPKADMKSPKKSSKASKKRRKKRK